MLEGALGVWGSPWTLCAAGALWGGDDDWDRSALGKRSCETVAGSVKMFLIY